MSLPRRSLVAFLGAVSSAPGSLVLLFLEDPLPSVLAPSFILSPLNDEGNTQLFTLGWTPLDPGLLGAPWASRGVRSAACGVLGLRRRISESKKFLFSQFWRPEFKTRCLQGQFLLRPSSLAIFFLCPHVVFPRCLCRPLLS